MNVRELFTVQPSKVLTAVIPAVFIGLFGCFTVSRCAGKDCSAYIDIPCFLIALVIVFIMIWIAYSVAKMCALANKAATIASILFVFLLLIVLMLCRGIIFYE